MSTTIRDHLDTASEAIREANHATHGRLLVVTDVYDVVAVLDELAGRMPQLVGYLARSVEHDWCDVFDDRGHDPRLALTDAGHALAGAAGSLDALGVHTRTAHNALGHLGRRHSED